MKQPSGAIFDLDGTLLDSMHVWDRVEERYLEGLGITRTPAERGRYASKSLQDSAAHYKREYDLPFAVGEIVDGINKVVERAYFEQVQAKPGADTFLRGLHAKGVPLCVATLTDRHLVEAALDRLGLLGLFEGVFTCAEVGASKDQPDVYDAARALIGTPAERTAVFEDSWFAACTAGRAGYYVVGVYDVNAAKYVEKLKAASDLYIERFEDLSHWIG